MTYAYRVDTGKRNQGQALLDEGSIRPRPDMDSLTTMDAMALATGEGGETYKTPSK
jgi:hypothetical protein